MRTLLRSQVRSRRVSAAVGLIATVAGGSGAFGGEPAADLPDGQRLLEILRQADTEMLRAFSAAIEVSEPACTMWSEQGAMTRTGVLVCAGETSCLVLENPRFEKAPEYVHCGSIQYSGRDYDAERNMIVWLHGDLYFLRDESLNDTFQENILTRVAPDNTVTKTAGTPTLSRYVVADSNGSYLFARVLLATGRGFGKHIDSFTEVAVGSSGLIEARAVGSHGRQMPGEWSLTIDPAAAYLVRSASFTPAGRSKPLVVISTTGTQGGEAGSMPLTGQFTYGLSDWRYPFRTDVKLNEVARSIDQACIERARAKVAGELPAGTDVWDHRSPGADPKRWRVGEEED